MLYPLSYEGGREIVSLGARGPHWVTITATWPIPLSS